MNSILRLLVRFAVWSILAVSAATGAAETYPSRHLMMLTSYPPGGGTDLLARLISQKLSERWGQTVVVENRVGGNGIIGVRAAISAPPDGYTLYMGSSNHVVMLESQFSNLPFNTLRDLIPVTPVAIQHSVLVVHPSLPVNTVQELVAFGKRNPGKLNFASPGIGGYEHLEMLFFQKEAGIDATHVPYKGSAEAVAAVLSGGDVSAMFSSIATVTPHITAGRLRGLTVTAQARSLALPQIPTVVEVGFPDMVMYSWNGVFVPAGTPADIVAKLNREILAILKEPEVVEKLNSFGFLAYPLSPQDFKALIASETQRWLRIVTDLGIERQKL